jgi:hypothetical protein
MLESELKSEPQNVKYTKSPSLTVYYDLLYGPITFDFIPFMANAHLVMNILGAAHISLNIIGNQFRDKTPREKIYDSNQKLWRFSNIIKQSIDLMPNVTDFRYSFKPLESLELPYFPSNYPPRVNERHKFILPYQPSFALSLPKHMDFAHTLRFLKAPTFAHQLIQKKVPNPSNGISITLRTSTFQEQRNSNLKAWKALFDYLTLSGYEVFVIPDFEDVFGERRAWQYDWNILEDIAGNHCLRQAVYERCILNLAVNNGTTALLSYSSNPVLVFKILTQGIATTSAEFLRQSSGVPVGGKPFHFLPNQDYIWAEDQEEILIHTVSAWLETHT